jgi:stage II sporulation protein D
LSAAAPWRTLLPVAGFLAAGLLAPGSAVEGWPAQQERLPAPIPPRGATFSPRVPQLLRVGLATDRSAVSIPCCQGNLVISGGGRTLGVSSSIRVEAAAEVHATAFYRLQVAALKDQQQGESLAAWLSAELAQPADSVFDAESDLYRVRVGRYGTRVEAEQATRRLGEKGLDAWIVNQKAELGRTGFRVLHVGGETRIEGRWLSISRSEGDGLRIENRRFRGRILLFLNDRGSLNLINELSLEDYLRGVVPKEMGPIAYSNLEALKAQTVAARTYTVRNLGEFDDEGYDICATPRCQVFGGMDAEHPLSDKAVAETALEVMVYEGDTVDALYSSSCGGHTEDVELIFPLKTHAYLRGVPCPEAGVDLLGGTLERGVPFVAGLMEQLLPRGAEALGPDRVERRLVELANLAGLPVPRESLGSLDRVEVRRYVGSLFDLVLDARLFSSGVEAGPLLESPPREWSSEDLQLATYLDRTGLLTGPFEGRLEAVDLDEMLYQLAVYLDVIHSRQASFQSSSGNSIAVRSEAGTEVIELPDAYATFRGGEFQLHSAPLVLAPGDALTLYLHGERLLAISQRVDGDQMASGAGPAVKPWRRMHSDTHLKQMVRDRYPEIDFAGFKILKRGVSGRVGAIRLVGSDGATVEVEGLAVRWTLDLPDTLFSVRRVEPEGREPGWLFTGRGHGHGVGMCQLGAYAMGVRGTPYREILSHYYSGVTLTHLELTEREAIAESD